jgi:hypothetical protein
MSILGNLRKVLENDLANEVSEHNALKIIFGSNKSVTVTFYIFLRKGFRSFFCHLYMEVNGDKITSKNIHNFYCDNCDFRCCKKGDWDRHTTTLKHTKLAGANENYTKNQYECKFCNKIYGSRNGIWKHTKICKKNTETMDIVNEPSDKQIIMMLIKDNSEFKNMMMEQQKSMIELIKNGTHNTNISNSNNKTFNLQVYLNETCKDAINLTDFVDSIKVQIKDLVKVGEKGYAEGISEIFINNLQQLNTHSRPIHCSDSKRETIYIKDEDQWSKDDESKTILTKAIKQVANKNIKQISEWQKLHPEYSDPESKQNDKYMKIVLNSMSGSTKEESNKNYEKIVKNVIKETIIEK